jgi:N-carbamoylputrescine amidase
MDDSKVLDGIRFWGNSFVVDAQGTFLCRLAENEEEVQLVDIDLKKSEELRRIWPFLRDRRIENYSELTKRFID